MKLKWLQSIRAISVVLTFILVFVVILAGKVDGNAVQSIITFLLGTVIGGYFGKRDETPPPDDKPTVQRISMENL
jgi:hypothetical protein